MDPDEPADLLFQTYYMIDWTKARQTDCGTTCVTCGQMMKRVEPMRDRNGALYDGLVCHRCKSIFWVRRG